MDVNKVVMRINQAGADNFVSRLIGKSASLFITDDRIVNELFDAILTSCEKVVYIESWQYRRDGLNKLPAWRAQGI